jgi:creatinine amidohydrolase
MMDIVPDLVHRERAGQQSGVDQERLKHLTNVYTGIWWYAQYPNHYSGDGSKANAAAGKLILDHEVNQFVETIRKIKNDTVVPALQEHFYKESKNPLNIKN